MHKSNCDIIISILKNYNCMRDINLILRQTRDKLNHAYDAN